MRLAFGIYLVALAIAFYLEPKWTAIVLGAGVVLGGPPVVALGWWMHTWSERDPYMTPEQRRATKRRRR